jgi:hypothetical protein
MIKVLVHHQSRANEIEVKTKTNKMLPISMCTPRELPKRLKKKKKGLWHKTLKEIDTKASKGVAIGKSISDETNYLAGPSMKK